MRPSEFVLDIIDKYIGDEKLKKLLITHSGCVARKALALAENNGLVKDIDTQFLVDAAFLHDIGVVECDAPSIFCYGKRPYLQHGLAGAEIIRKEGLDSRLAAVCENHIGCGLTASDIEKGSLPLPSRNFIPGSLEEKLICFADNFFSKSKNPEREKSIEEVDKSMKRFGPDVYARFLELKKFFSS